MPKRAHSSDAGADLISVESFTLAVGKSVLVDSGVSMAIPEGYAGFIYNRSSQGKLEVSIPNSVGVIDSSYRGNIKIRLKNNGTEPYVVTAFDTRVAQLVIAPIWLGTFVETTKTKEEWVDTARGTGGFGSTDTVKVQMRSPYFSGMIQGG
jgi:dUTP pyrophosphatase